MRVTHFEPHAIVTEKNGDYRFELVDDSIILENKHGVFKFRATLCMHLVVSADCATVKNKDAILAFVDSKGEIHRYQVDTLILCTTLHNKLYENIREKIKITRAIEQKRLEDEKIAIEKTEETLALLHAELLMLYPQIDAAIDNADTNAFYQLSERMQTVKIQLDHIKEQTKTN